MSAASTTFKQYQQAMIADMNKAGFIHCQKISDTLQGSIWSATHKKSKRQIVIKATDKELHSNSMHIAINGVSTKVSENILMEKSILKYITKSHSKQCPDSVVQYIGFFKSKLHYYLVMSHGGKCLFDFIVRAHRLIEVGQIDINEWHNVIKIIFKQMIEAVEYIHSLNVCHNDVSLENFVINDVKVIPINNNKQIKFLVDDIQIKLCDLGLAELFPSESQYRNFQSTKFVGKTQYKSPEINERKVFNAKANDVWCLGVCLFMMIIGGSPPWKSACKTDEAFRQILNGQLIELLMRWNRLHYVNKEILHLFHSIFQYESKRTNISKMKQHLWLK